MNARATIANLAWAASSLPAYTRFRRALRNPGDAQRTLLRRLIASNAGSAFGRAHDFASLRSYEDFASRVPLATYDDLVPWISRITGGESQVLGAETITRLVPTSGSTGARKLIPFTAGLQRQFNAAIGPWMVDLFREQPGLLGGSAYWSLSPLSPQTAEESSAVPIGFDDDAAYLGGVRKRLVDAVMAVPAAVRHETDIAAFRRATLVALLHRRDLRLISVWHPSFLALLLDELIASWDDLVTAAGEARLRRADPRDLRTIWPQLRLVSCWADGHAALAAQELARRLGGVRMQAKGLLATEACVTLPFRGARPLAVTSHFFEFVAEDGRVLLANALRKPETYEVVVTTAGGLWRYRLGDHVVVDGFSECTPSLQFVGRSKDVSDRCGEKLTETFVAGVFRDFFSGGMAPRFAMLAPDEDDTGCRYTLFVEGATERCDPARLDAALRANPHYAWCRDLGQLRDVRVFPIAGGGFDAFVARGVARGCRFGDVKAVALSNETGWSEHFRPARGRAEANPVLRA